MNLKINWGDLQTARLRGEDTLDVVQGQLGIDAAQAAHLVATELGLTLWDAPTLAQATPQLDRWPLSQALANLAVVVRDPHGSLHAVLADPLEDALIARLMHLANQEQMQLGLAEARDLKELLDRHSLAARSTHQIANPAREVGLAMADETVLVLVDPGEHDHPAVRLVNAALLDALRTGASDVHLECTPAGLTVKLRIDGMLEGLTTINDTALAEQAISRLKVLAELDIGERRVPQDGSFRVHWMGRGIDLRLSIIPGLHGEDAVLRVLDKRSLDASGGPLSLQGLGFDAGTIGSLRRSAQAAHGMVLVTGPTGSGKTTTLYALLGDSRSGREKIITIEDPVEYQLEGVLQIPVNERKGLTFARGLRSVLRHDPDTIMVGEIRDRDTAEMAVQSALTGHLVLTTLHANSVFDVFDRLTHMGLDPHALASALNGVWAQRLLRCVCPRCAADHVGAADEWTSLSPREFPNHARFSQGKGCDQCRGTGYRGRKAIAEVLVLDDELRELVVCRAPVRQLKAVARERGVKSLREVALDLAAKGVTTLKEVRRVTVEA
ncbi:GspE/PulE family protein [Hydrogenophaga sp. XSHU_21]